jgi:uncharacterized cofD-like protein
LPNLLVPDIAHAIRASRALKIFVCNVATQRGETEDFNCGDHVRVIEQHIGETLFDIVVCNQNYKGKLPEGVEWVKIEEDLEEDYAIYRADLVDVAHPWRHDAQKLAQVLIDLLEERTGPLAS